MLKYETSIEWSYFRLFYFFSFLCYIASTTDILGQNTIRIKFIIASFILLFYAEYGQSADKLTYSGW